MPLTDIGPIPTILIKLNNTKQAVDCSGQDDNLVKLLEDADTMPVLVMLPLPISPNTVTGLPVIINAFFALSENRRELKWKTSDDQSDQVQWNLELLELWVPECYSEFLANLSKSSLESPKCSFKFWPKEFENSIHYKIPTNWNTCSMETIRLLLKKPCL